MASMEISGHNQVFQHVMTSFEKTNDFIEEHQENEEKTEEIKEKIIQDLSTTLVMILDNMGRSKAIQALEIYREHEKFRKHLEQMKDDEPSQRPFQDTAAAGSAPDKGEEPVDDGFLSVLNPVSVPEEEKKELEVPKKVVVKRRSSTHIVRADADDSTQKTKS